MLIRIETRAGHGAGKPTTKRIEEAADLWSFLVENLDVTLPELYGESELTPALSGGGEGRE